MRKIFTFLLALVASVGMMTTSLWAQSITIAVDTESQFVPTQIVNGDFSTRPFMQFRYNDTWYNTWSESSPDLTPWSEIRPNGIGEGWNTTETMIYDHGEFEWTNAMNIYNPTLNTNGNNAGHDYFIEMNAFNSAVFYQDLATNGHDVIRWSLQHAVRTGYADPQSMRVEIGAPQRDGSNNIVAASGVNAAVDAKIIASTKATYTSSGYTGYNGYAGDYSGLSLALSQNAQWYTVTGVYSIPEGQDVTRFAFIATNTYNVGGGNLLDNLTFSTLIGNLSAQQLANNDVELKGYWGETDPSKKLKVVIDDVVHEVNMSSVVGKYFKITIPAAIVGTATSVETYHQDYQAAKISTAVEPEPAPQPQTIHDSDDAATIETFLSTNNGTEIAELTIDRPVLNNMYNTLCLPFDMDAAQIAASSLNGVEIYELEEVTVANDELFLGLSDAVNAVVAGRPYIVKYSAASQLDDLDFENVTINNANLTAQAIKMNGVTFKGTFTPFVMGIQNGFDTNGGYLFLGQNNQLYWPNTNNPLKPFRAYFYIDLNSGSGNAPLRFGMPARIGRPATTPTGVENVQSDKVQSIKVIENGQLIIIKNGIKYNAQGQKIEN